MGKSTRAQICALAESQQIVEFCRAARLQCCSSLYTKRALCVWSLRGKSTRAQICALVQNLQSTAWWNKGVTLLRAHPNRVPLHRHEVQRRGARKACIEVAGVACVMYQVP